MFATNTQAAKAWTLYSRYGGFEEPGGVVADSSGNMYVADAVNNRIQKLNADTQAWSEWGKRGGQTGSSLGEFDMPLGLTVDSQDNLYVADTWNSRIQKLDANTNIWSEWTTAGAFGEFKHPYGVTVDSKGNMYVADTGNHRILKRDAVTLTWSRWGTIDDKAGTGLGEFNRPTSVAIDSDGNVYVADMKNDRIQRLEADTNTWSEWKEADELGRFDDPMSIAIDSTGNIYVADTYNFRILKREAATNIWSEWTMPGDGAVDDWGDFSIPFGVSVDSADNLYIADTGNDRIFKRDATTNEWSRWTSADNTAGTGLGEFYYPTGVAVDSHGNAYVADVQNNRIQKLDAVTNTWSEWKKNGGEAGSGLGEFDHPFAVAVDRSDNLFVSDMGNGRVQKLDVSTNQWSEWKQASGGSYSDLGAFSYPMGIAVDRHGNVYVADSYNFRIQKLDAATNQWSEWKKADDLGNFDRPSGIAVDGNDNVYVAELMKNRILKLDSATNTWSELQKTDGGAGNSLGEFIQPLNISVDSIDNVYVADSGNHRIQQLDVATDTWSEWGSGQGSGVGQFIAPSGVAVGSNGKMYVADAGNNRIQRYQLPVAVPDAPTEVTAVAGIGQATVSFTPSASNGGSAIMSYTVISNPGNLTATGMTSPITINGLTNGTSYTFAVFAKNGVGFSLASESSSSAMPIGDVTAATVDASKNSVSATGDRQFEEGVTSGDERFIPTSWSSTEAGKTGAFSLSGGTYRAEYMPSAAGNYTVTVTFLKQTWVGGQWTDTTFTDTKTATVASTVNSGSSSGGDMPVVSQASSDTPVVPQASGDAVIVLVNGKAGNAGISTKSTREGQSVFTILVDQKTIEAKLAEEGLGAVVSISVSAKSDVVIGELNGQMIKNMENKKAVLQIKTDTATFTLPAQQINIDAISGQIGKTVALQDIRIRIEIAATPASKVAVVENAAAKGMFSVVVPSLDFTASAVYGSSSVEVSKFNVYVERAIAIPDGIDPNKITTGVVVDSDGMIRHVPTKVVQLDGRYYAVVNSLTNSTYSIVWHPLEFSDVAEHWASKAVNDMGSRMVIDGTGGGLFSPDRDITRAEFAAVIVRGLGLKLENGAVPFSDVKAENWYGSAVNTAYTYGLIAGFEDGTFRPMDKITREQAVVVLARAMAITGLKAKWSALSEDAVLRPFGDVADVSGWARGSMADSVQAGLVSGRSAADLAPKAFITRAEMASVIQRLLQKSGLI
ncbi:unnamed protein product [Aphanomyces euteiches]